MVDNPGFLNLYTFIKDALLSKVGILKFWWEDSEEIEEERYHDLTDDQYDLIKSDPEVEVLEHETHPVEDQALVQALSQQALPPPSPQGPPGAGPPQQGGVPQGPPQGAPPVGQVAPAPVAP